jgi:hypothetical protein
MVKLLVLFYNAVNWYDVRTCMSVGSYQLDFTGTSWYFNNLYKLEKV